MRFKSWLVLLLLGLLPQLGVVAQGTLAGETSIEAPADETPEERIARLKRELIAAEEAALASRKSVEPKAPEKEASSGGAIPSGALVIVKGAEGGGGSGFIAELRGQTFFVTNIHVLAAARGASFETVAGVELRLPQTVFVSRKRDLAIVPISWAGDSLKVSPSLSFDKVAIGDAITVMGNADGVGVATQLTGDIDGIGPTELEISAKFVPGNSGSPIIHDELGSVVGVVSHMRDFSDKDKWTEDSELSDIRRFGFRLDCEIQWQRISLHELFEQGEIYARFEDRTSVLAKTIYMLANERTIMTGYSSHDSLGHLFEPFESGFSWKRGTSSGHNLIKLQRFTNALHNELVTDRQTTSDDLKIDFFKRRFQDVDGVRDYFIDQLDRVNF